VLRQSADGMQQSWLPFLPTRCHGFPRNPLSSQPLEATCHCASGGFELALSPAVSDEISSLTVRR